ncbi:hypothetical protein ACVWWP_002202 [Bradyrhizobium sp. LM3.6]
MATKLFKHLVGAPSGRLAQWSRSAELPGGTIEGHTIPMTEVGCSDIRALQEGRQRYFWVSRLSDDIVRQKKFPELRVEVRPIGHHLSLRKICRSGIGIGIKGRKIRAAAARPKTRRRDFMTVCLLGHLVRQSRNATRM